MSEESKQNNDDALPQPIKEVEPAPDGGLKAWLTILGSFLSIFVQFGLGKSLISFIAAHMTQSTRLASSKFTTRPCFRTSPLRLSVGLAVCSSLSFSVV